MKQPGNKPETNRKEEVNRKPALAEKYRPSSWNEVIGQEKVITRLHKLAEGGTLAGLAYWLSGQTQCD